MKTYTVLMSETATPAVKAMVDFLLTGFALAIKSSSSYRWHNLNLSSTEQVRWFDTNCENAVSALKAELSNFGIQVEPQSQMFTADGEVNPEYDIYFSQELFKNS